MPFPQNPVTNLGTIYVPVCFYHLPSCNRTTRLQPLENALPVMLIAFIRHSTALLRIDRKAIQLAKLINLLSLERTSVATFVILQVMRGCEVKSSTPLPIQAYEGVAQYELDVRAPLRATN